MNRRQIIGVLAFASLSALPMGAQGRNCQIEGDVLKCDDGVSYRQAGVTTVTTISPDGRTAKKLADIPSPADGLASQQAGDAKSAGNAAAAQPKPESPASGH